MTGFTSGWDVGMRERVKLKIPPKFLSWTTRRIEIPLTDTWKSQCKGFGVKVLKLVMLSLWCLLKIHGEMSNNRLLFMRETKYLAYKYIDHRVTWLSAHHHIIRSLPKRMIYGRENNIRECVWNNQKDKIPLTYQLLTFHLLAT